MERIKKFLTILALTAMVACSSAYNAGYQMRNLVDQYSYREGFDVINVGSGAFRVLKAIIRHASISDSDAAQALMVMKGLKGLTIVDYSEASDADRANFESRSEQILKHNELLIEARENGKRLMIYGKPTGANGDKLKDFILYSPDNSALVCLFGTADFNRVAEILEKE